MACVIALLAGCVQWSAHDDRLVRVELLALMQTLNAELLSHDSATLTLERWCADHRLAQPAKILARRMRDVAKPIPDDLRARLALGPADTIAYRRVQLVCGDRVLSEADNWYVRSRLTAEMNHTLETTDEPFGKVVKALDFRRRTLSAELLWSPLPSGWEMSANALPATSREALTMPHAVLRHQAILYDAAQQPFSALVETYTSEVFVFSEFGNRQTP